MAVIYDTDAPSASGLARRRPWIWAVRLRCPGKRRCRPADLHRGRHPNNGLFFFVLGFIVILGVINTMLMSVLERVRSSA